MGIEHPHQDVVLQLCDANVWHKRLRPFKHPLNYRMFCLRLRMDKTSELVKKTNWLFGFNRRRLIAFMNADHGSRDGADLGVWLDQTLAAANIKHPGGAVWLQTFPRMLGYVFNPVSFWYLYDSQDQVRVIVAAVNNTFGQHHNYVLTMADGSPIQSGRPLVCQKVFYVSPFCAVKGHYAFERVTNQRVDRMTIDYFDDSTLTEPLIRTGIAVEPRTLTTAGLLKSFLRMPFMTFGVIVRIHWHAWKLWRAGARFHKLADLPNQEVTSNQEPFR